MTDPTPNLSLTISPEVVGPIIENKIRLAIIDTLSKDHGRLIEAIVEKALTEQVAANGKRSRSSYENETPFVEAVTRNAIQEAVREAVQEWLAKNAGLLKKEMQKVIARKKNMLATAFAESLVEKAKSNYAMTIAVEFKRSD